MPCEHVPSEINQLIYVLTPFGFTIALSVQVSYKYVFHQATLSIVSFQGSLLLRAIQRRVAEQSQQSGTTYGTERAASIGYDSALWAHEFIGTDHRALTIVLLLDILLVTLSTLADLGNLFIRLSAS